MAYIEETERIGLLVMTIEHIEEIKQFWGNPEVVAESGGAAKHKDLPKPFKLIGIVMQLMD